jgi:DNA polymerase-4
MQSHITRLCRDCGRLDDDVEASIAACPACGSPRLIAHAELRSLSIAHVDCDAYYASIEKRDHPEFADQPLIVGGRERGVVTTCCYIARQFGVRSAMPTSQAMKLCPHAVVIKPDMEKYQRESRRIRELMYEATPVVEGVSIDEAYLDLAEAAAGRDEPPARSLARLALQIERKVGVTVSIGLAPSKMLAKIASDMGKPRGFSVIGRNDALDVIGPMKISALPGVGPVMTRKLEALGMTRVCDLWSASESDLIHRFGLWARRLVAFSRAEDNRKVASHRGKSVTVGAETTFNFDLRTFEQIDAELRRLCDTVARRLAKSGLAASGLTLKLRRADRRTVTRAARLRDPTARPELILKAVQPVLAAELAANDVGQAYRLVGVTATRLVSDRLADPPDLFGTIASRSAQLNEIPDPHVVSRRTE